MKPTFAVYADGNEIYRNENNIHALVRLPLELTARELTVRFFETWGEETVHLVACDAE